MFKALAFAYRTYNLFFHNENNFLLFKFKSYLPKIFFIMMILGMGLYVLKYIKNSKINNKIPRLLDTKLDLRHERIIPYRNTNDQNKWNNIWPVNCQKMKIKSDITLSYTIGNLFNVNFQFWQTHDRTGTQILFGISFLENSVSVCTKSF